MRCDRPLRAGAVFAGLALALAACGGRPLDRGLSGGAVGAGIGAATGAATGGDMTSAAILGGAAGAAAGVLTDRHSINLGRPLWRR